MATQRSKKSKRPKRSPSRLRYVAGNRLRVNKIRRLVASGRFKSTAEAGAFWDSVRVRRRKRAMVTGAYAGLFACQVCVVPDATDEEILAVCNRDDPRTEGFSWTKVIRTKEDVKAEGLRSLDGSSVIPGQCVECPPRLHMIVR